jgi:hypothetical protein
VQVGVKFFWYDVWSQDKVGSATVHYEKACVLFNIASIHSIMGTRRIATQ